MLSLKVRHVLYIPNQVSFKLFPIVFFSLPARSLLKREKLPMKCTSFKLEKYFLHHLALFSGKEISLGKSVFVERLHAK